MESSVSTPRPQEAAPELAGDSPPLADLALFTRQLGAMLDAGVSVLRALRIASRHSGNATLIQVAQGLALDLENGIEFHRAVAKYPALFDPFYVEMCRQGEADGVLGRAMMSVADYLDRLAESGAPAGDGWTAVSPVGRGTGGGAGSVLRTLGRASLGVAAVWGLAASGGIPRRWIGPLATAWSGFCLLQGAGAVGSGGPAGGMRPRPLPPKSRARKLAETEGVVRNALDEQMEALEASVDRLSELASPPDLFFTADEPPRFD